MRTRRSRTEQAEQVRRDLMAAAREIFLSDGYHGASLDRIAAVAGYTKGVVYSRFASKADLFLALLEERVEQRARQNDELAAGLQGVEGLVELAQRWTEIERDAAPWTLLVIEFRVHASRDRELTARYATLHATLHDRTVKGVEAVLDRLLGPGTGARVARVLFVFSLGGALERASGTEAISTDDLVRVVEALGTSPPHG